MEQAAWVIEVGITRGDMLIISYEVIYSKTFSDAHGGHHADYHNASQIALLYHGKAFLELPPINKYEYWPSHAEDGNYAPGDIIIVLRGGTRPKVERRNPLICRAVSPAFKAVEAAQITDGRR